MNQIERCPVRRTADLTAWDVFMLIALALIVGFAAGLLLPQVKP